MHAARAVVSTSAVSTPTSPAFSEVHPVAWVVSMMLSARLQVSQRRACAETEACRQGMEAVASEQEGMAPINFHSAGSDSRR